jgi:hypothetical protein
MISTNMKIKELRSGDRPTTTSSDGSAAISSPLAALFHGFHQMLHDRVLEKLRSTLSLAEFDRVTEDTIWSPLERMAVTACADDTRLCTWPHLDAVTKDSLESGMHAAVLKALVTTGILYYATANQAKLVFAHRFVQDFYASRFIKAEIGSILAANRETKQAASGRALPGIVSRSASDLETAPTPTPNVSTAESTLSQQRPRTRGLVQPLPPLSHQDSDDSDAQNSITLSNDAERALAGEYNTLLRVRLAAHVLL